jgi:hypothetical protein
METVTWYSYRMQQTYLLFHALLLNWELLFSIHFNFFNLNERKKTVSWFKVILHPSTKLQQIHELYTQTLHTGSSVYFPHNQMINIKCIVLQWYGLIEPQQQTQRLSNSQLIGVCVGGERQMLCVSLVKWGQGEEIALHLGTFLILK